MAPPNSEGKKCASDVRNCTNGVNCRYLPNCRFSHPAEHLQSPPKTSNLERQRQRQQQQQHIDEVRLLLNDIRTRDNKIQQLATEIQQLRSDHEQLRSDHEQLRSDDERHRTKIQQHDVEKERFFKLIKEYWDGGHSVDEIQPSEALPIENQVQNSPLRAQRSSLKTSRQKHVSFAAVPFKTTPKIGIIEQRIAMFNQM